MNQSDHSRVLGGVNSSTPSPPPPPLLGSVSSGFLVLLASLICALICIIGLFAVSRCAWFRRVFGTAALPLPPPQANKGLKKKILRSLPKLSFAAAEHAPKLSECAICLTEFVGGDEIRILPQCGHGFHVGCIDTWLGSHSSCPSCRQILVAGRCHKCGELPSAASSSAVADTRIFAYQTNYHVNAIFP